METYTQDVIYGNFRTPRYDALNKCRWDHFLSMGIPIEGKWIFEPGAGIGDQTAWLLEHGASYIYVNEGRPGNREIIRERFGKTSKVSVIHGYLEECLSEYDFKVDLVFCYGVYYHLRETPEFKILGEFSKLGETMVFDYLAGSDNEIFYGYDNPSTSVSQYALRPRPESIEEACRKYWEFAYRPKIALEWVDPTATEDRRVLVASHSRLNNPNLIQI